jgi:hypothetical protein
VVRRKAAGPATDSVNGPHADSQAGELESHEAKSPRAACLSVYDGRTYVGAIRRRDGRFIAIDADNAVRSLPKAELGRA